MKRFTFYPAMLGLLIVLQGIAFAQDVVPSSGVSKEALYEIERRGDMCQLVNGTQSDNSIEQQIADSVRPPADDSDKWFITVITSAGCPPCDRLKADWSAKDELQAWARPQEPAKGWAFYHAYDVNDPLNKFRWEKIKVEAFPTVLIQPPRSGNYGPPETVVVQIQGYDGDAKKFSGKIRDSIQRYMVSLRNKPTNSGPTIQETAKAKDTRQVEVKGHADTSDSGWKVIEAGPTIKRLPPGGNGQVPFPVGPSQPSNNPLVLPVGPDPVTPVTPTVNPAPNQSPLQAIATLLGVVNQPWFSTLLLVGFVGMTLFRSYRKSTGQQLILTDEQFAMLANIMKPPTK